MKRPPIHVRIGSVEGSLTAPPRLKRRDRYVVCPEKISGPAPEQDWIPADMPCGLKCKVNELGPVMEFRCACGHWFIASPADIVVSE